MAMVRMMSQLARQHGFRWTIVIDGGLDRWQNLLSMLPAPPDGSRVILDHQRQLAAAWLPAFGQSTARKRIGGQCRHHARQPCGNSVMNSARQQTSSCAGWKNWKLRRPQLPQRGASRFATGEFMGRRRFKKRRKSYETGLVLEAFDRAASEADRIAPLCRHFGTCGGCNLQDLSYEDQVAAKRAVFVDLARQQQLEQDFDLDDVRVVASEQQFGYRQRMDFVRMPEGAGLRQAGRFRSVVPLEECPLIGDAGVRALHAARDLAAECGQLPPYDLISHEGVLRYIVVRRNRQDQIMVSLVTTSVAPEEVIADLAHQLLKAGTAHSVHWLHNDGQGDTSFGADVRHWGMPTLPEHIHELAFELGPNSFFQANPAIAELAYGEMRDWLQGSNYGLDLYTGTGTIACLLAKVCRKVEAVELDPANIELAEQNIDCNDITNVALHQADVAKWVTGFTGEH